MSDELVLTVNEKGAVQLALSIEGELPCWVEEKDSLMDYLYPHYFFVGNYAISRIVLAKLVFPNPTSKVGSSSLGLSENCYSCKHWRDAPIPCKYKSTVELVFPKSLCSTYTDITNKTYRLTIANSSFLVCANAKWTRFLIRNIHTAMEGLVRRSHCLFPFNGNWSLLEEILVRVAVYVRSNRADCIEPTVERYLRNYSELLQVSHPCSDCYYWSKDSHITCAVNPGGNRSTCQDYRQI